MGIGGRSAPKRHDTDPDPNLEFVGAKFLGATKWKDRRGETYLTLSVARGCVNPEQLVVVMGY